MKVETITYRRVKNLGNYESEALEASYTLTEEDDQDLAFENLKTWVEVKLRLTPANSEAGSLAF